MRRTLFIVTFACSMLLSNSIWAQEFIVDGIKYSVLSAENRTVEVISNGWSSYTGDIVIPETVEYDDAIYNVTAVGESAFWFCSDMTSVVIPNSVTVINRRAFAFCWNAGDIQLPANVVTIGDEAFMVCSGIRTINIPSSVTSIGENAFAIFSENDPDVNTYYIETLNWNCNLDFSVIAKSFMGEYNRVRDYNVRNLVIGKDVTRFNFCYAPFNDPFDESRSYLTVVEGISVDNNNSLFDSRNNCNAIINTSQNKLLAGLNTTVIPNDVTSIGECAFFKCSQMENIIIPASVSSIGHDAFAGCTSLESFSIPLGVTSIEYKTFFNCSNLEEITIPASVNSIGSSAFEGCSSLATDITIPAETTAVEYGTFYGCSHLTSVTIPEGVINIGSFAFCGCSSLTSITIPEGVTTIGDNAFCGCNGLTSLRIPSSVTDISISAFLNCSGLQSIEVDENNTIYDSRNNCNAIIMTATNELIAGSNTTQVPNGISSIGYDAFSGRTGLVDIILPNSITSIGSSAFAGCSNLESINLPAGVTSIGYYAFQGCIKLTSIEIPHAVDLIGREAFQGCSALSSVTIYSSTPPLLLDEIYYSPCNQTFGDNADGRKIHVFSDLVNTYQNASVWKDLYVDDIMAIPDLTANNAGGELGNWCSYYNGMADVKLSDDVIIYKASLDGDNVRLTEIDGHIINKGNAVLLKSTSDAITLESAPDMVVGDYSDNELAGIDTPKAQSDGKLYYVISKVADTFGFYKLNPEVLLGAHKAYLEVENRSMAPARSYYSFGLSADGTETEIYEPFVEDKGDWYTVYGTKLNGMPVESGLYIHNGKKILIK